MLNQLIENVYYTMLGELTDENAIPGVENAFAGGSPCDIAYREMLEAYERLRLRLGVEDEDQDVETIVNSLLDVQQALCMAMFRYGMKYRAL